MSQTKETPVKGAKNKNQYVCGFNDSYDFILTKLKDFFFDNEFIKKDGKWTFTKFCILSKLYDYADEVLEGFQYTPDQLLGLIEYHNERADKFKVILDKLALEKKLKDAKILSRINIDLGDVSSEEIL